MCLFQEMRLTDLLLRARMDLHYVICLSGVGNCLRVENWFNSTGNHGSIGNGGGRRGQNHLEHSRVKLIYVSVKARKKKTFMMNLSRVLY